MVIEATYGWYWAVDLLRDAGFWVHLAHPSGNDWGKRRVKNDERDARTWRTCCVWSARGGVDRTTSGARGTRAGPLSSEAGAAAQWSQGAGACGDGQRRCAARRERHVRPERPKTLLDAMELADAYLVRVESLRDLIEGYDREVGMLERRIHELLRDDRGYQAIQALDGVGRTLAAIFVTEIGDISRFRSPEALCSWAGLTPAIASPTPKSCAARSPNKVRSWCVGRRSKRSSATTAAHPREHFHRIAERRGTNKARGRDRAAADDARLLRPTRRRDPLPPQRAAA